MPNIILVQNDYNSYHDLRRVINYISRSGIVGAYAADCNYACEQFIMVKEAFAKRDYIQLKHFIISFSSQDFYRLTIDECLQLGFKIGKTFKEYQMVYAVHYDTEHIHLHVVMNTTSFVDGRQYSDGIRGFSNLKRVLQRLFPKSNVRLYFSYPKSECNRFSYTSEDEFLRIG